jgi:cytochrome P450
MMSVQAPSGPAHVPSHLVRDFNYFDQPDCDADPHAAWKLLHDGPDIFYSPQLGGHWVVTRGADLKAMLNDHDLFSSTVNAIPRAGLPFRMAPIEFDPPDHKRLKVMGVPSFAPPAVKKLETRIRELSDSLIDGFIERGNCEFVDDFALRMPIEIFMGMSGLPDADRAPLLSIMDDRMRNPNLEVQERASVELVAYSERILAARLAAPGRDLISELIEAQPDGVAATRDELLGYATLLFFAGLDTVSSSMGFMARFLAENPAHRRQIIADPPLLRNAIEEMLRRFGVSTPSRIVTRDSVYRGVEMRKGDMVLLPVTLHGLDERVYRDPMTVNFARKDAAQHLTFGTGIHRCIGSFLARTELRIFIETWLRRIPEFEITPGKRPTARAGVINSILTLPLSWQAT